jgi:hypothetical protein
MIDWAVDCLAKGASVVSVKMNPQLDFIYYGEIYGQIFGWSDSMETRMIATRNDREVKTLDIMNYRMLVGHWNNHRRGRDGALTDSFTAGAMTRADYVTTRVKTFNDPIIALYTLSYIGNQNDTVKRVLDMYRKVKMFSMVNDFGQRRFGDIVVSEAGWVDSIIDMRAFNRQGFYGVNIFDALYMLATYDDTKAIEPRARGTLNHTFFINDVAFDERFPEWRIQTTKFNVTDVVKTVTGFVRSIRIINNDDLYNLRRACLKRVYPSAEIKYEHEFTGWCRDEFGKHRVNVAGHLINMILAEVMHLTDVEFEIGIITFNLMNYVRRKRGGKMDKLQKKQMQLYADAELAEGGIPPDALYHSWYDLTLAVECCRVEYRTIGFVAHDNLLDYVEGRLNDLVNRYPDFRDDAYIADHR